MAASLQELIAARRKEEEEEASRRAFRASITREEAAARWVEFARRSLDKAEETLQSSSGSVRYALAWISFAKMELSMAEDLRTGETGGPFKGDPPGLPRKKSKSP